MIFISIEAPQDLQNHQKEERERRKAGDIYKRCGTARPTKPSERRERERKVGDIYKRCDTTRPILPLEGRERERERGEFLLIKMSRFVS